jgi:hypothetical protein
VVKSVIQLIIGMKEQSPVALAIGEWQKTYVF